MPRFDTRFATSLRIRKGNPTPFAMILIGTLLVPMVWLAGTDDDLVVSAQPVPQYADASAGLPDTDLWTAQPVFFDIDNDGVADIIIPGPRKGDGSKDVHVFKWNGEVWRDASLEEGTNNIPHSSYGGIALADLNNDGEWDMAVGSHGADRVDAYFRSVLNSWMRSSTGLQASEDAWDVSIGDFNNDGYLDLAVAGFWGMDLRVYAGNGQGQWIEHSMGLERGMASRIQARFCDVNNDGNLDLISNLRGGTWVYLGDGNGGWTNSSEGLPDDDYGVTVDCGDFNGDGYKDLAMSAHGRVWAFGGDGTGNWTDSSMGLPTSYFFKSLKLADMNNDGYDDMVGLTDEGIVEVYLATGTGGWVKADTGMIRGNARGWRLYTGDYDHNGHRDILAGFGTDQDTTFPGSIKVWRETTIPDQLEAFLDFPRGREHIKHGSIQFIRWRSAVPPGTGSREVKLEYSTTGQEGPWHLIEESLPDTGFHQWEVPSDATSGDCHIRVTVSDDMGSSASDMNDMAFGIGTNPNINYPPSITILSPSGENESADREYIIEWNATDPDGDELTISLFHDNDTDPDNGMHLIAEGLTNTGNWTWNTSGMEEGTYNIFGKAEDGYGNNGTGYSTGTVKITHDNEPDPPENRPPSLDILQPDGTDDDADEEFIIRWQAEDPDPDTITIDLYWTEEKDESRDWRKDESGDGGKDESGDGGGEAHLIVNNVTNTGSYRWDTRAMPEGQYYILGYANDNNGSRVSAYSRGPLTITREEPPPVNNPPEIEVSIAVMEDTDSMFLIEWTASDPDGDRLSVDLFYDTDTDPDNGIWEIAQGLDSSGEYQWDASPIEEGAYYIYAVATDPRKASGSAHSERFTVVHPVPTADFEITFFNILASSQRPGEQVFIQTRIRNIGEADGNGSVVITVGPVTIHTENITIRKGRDIQVNTIWTAVEGNHTISIIAHLDGDPTPENNMRGGSWIVEPGTGPRDDDDDNDDDGMSLMVMGAALTVAVVAAAVLIFMVRKGKDEEKGESGKNGIPCPSCGAGTEYSSVEDDHYCWTCKEYIGDLK